MKASNEFINPFDILYAIVMSIIILLVTIGFGGALFLHIWIITKIYFVVMIVICIYLLIFYLKLIIKGILFEIEYKKLEDELPNLGKIEKILFSKTWFIFKIIGEDGKEYWTNYYYYSFKYRKNVLIKQDFINKKVEFYLNKKGKAMIENIYFGNYYL